MIDGFTNERRQIRKGDVIRVRIENKQHSHYGGYAYAVATGGGFGCNPSSLGNAIFVEAETLDEEEAKKIIGMTRDERMAYGKSLVEMFEPNEDGRISMFYDPRARNNRWERYWGIEILVEDDEGWRSENE